jgi:ketosteroid isomerase-like protein
MAETIASPRLTEPRAALENLLSCLDTTNASLAVACFTRDARLITADRTVLCGRPNIRRLLAQLIDAGTTLELSEVVLTEAGEVALLTGGLLTHTPRPEGVLHSRRSDLTALLRIREGDWKFAILDPWGQHSR